jgi:perosamine synthetase
MFSRDDFVNFVRRIYKTDLSISLHEPRFGQLEKDLVLDCIESTFVSSVGKYVDQFESAIEEFTGAEQAVAVVNGTQALFIALKLAGAKEKTEVITQSLTFVATANAITYTGAHADFVDVETDTLGMSPDSLKDFLNANTTIKNGVCINIQTENQIVACVPMHTFGLACRVEEIKSICDEHNLILAEDAAESLGTFVGEQHTGTFGQMGILSFNGNKVITTGGGGMILFQDKTLAQRAKHLTTTAKVDHPWEFVHDEVGYNFRMPNINAALGVAQMKSLPRFIKRKRELHLKYKHYFSEKGISVFEERKGTKSNYWLNAILLKDPEQKDIFLKETNAAGVMTRGLWNPMHRLKMYEKCMRTDLRNTEELFDRVVNIPSSVVQCKGEE